jgi:hypothetical protein
LEAGVGVKPRSPKGRAAARGLDARPCLQHLSRPAGDKPTKNPIDRNHGIYWDVLTAFAEEPSFYIANDASALVCGPMTAEVADDTAFEEARRKIDAINEPVEWYFTLAAETPVAMAADDTGTPVAKVGTIAMPLLGFYPPEREGAPPLPTHYEVLLPSGRTGWVPVTAVRPLETDHLCYAPGDSGGSVIEIATIGREGCTGLQAAFGAKRSSVRFLVQLQESRHGCRARRSHVR